MAEIKLDVPLVAQKKAMSCWYASVCMVSYYYAQGPVQGLPNKWVADQGIQKADFVTLALAEGLKFLPSKDHDFTAISLMATIGFRGPIWCASHWKGYGHIVVITGCSTKGDDGGTVFINDPEPVDAGSTTTISLKTFNDQRERGGLLVA
ncbi:hypothetical protein MWU54_00795 [Marivita sp. S6314]|uniref:papain-like cysteine protease family protein n=1 Tax=Marivita sp. S6314 TaxID=2926406 RepID=UPI001FF6F446|nr:papain-like cysteine protease family protein [Marivita sp. S6314]MCK0148546.1 hypothetical protein [Marivita sp. S6314]